MLPPLALAEVGVAVLVAQGATDLDGPAIGNYEHLDEEGIEADLHDRVQTDLVEDLHAGLNECFAIIGPQAEYNVPLDEI